MTLLFNMVFTALLVLAPILAVLVHRIILFFEVPPLPNLGNTWWGRRSEEDNEEDITITPFKISFSSQEIEDLKTRLKATRTLTKPLRAVQQQYGLNAKALKPVLEYWTNEYNWSAREQYLNQFPQFKTNIQGLNVHFIHVKPIVPSGTQVLPLLILHGWPGSVREFYEIIPILTKVHERYGFAFEVVAPSLPGFGFSDGAVRPGLSSAEMSVVLKNLMLRLGHERFYVQAGDWGSVIISSMATLFPQHILGLHTNMPFVDGRKSIAKMFLGSLLPSLVVDKEHMHRIYPLSKRFGEIMLEYGYFHIQATKPDTIGVAINNSPAGLAAYILEKFSTATNANYKKREDAGLLEKFTYDELIDNLMFYWIPQCFTTAVRLYAEDFSREQRLLRLADIPISADVPCAVVNFPNELAYYPDWLLRDKYTNLIQSTEYKEGGHFAAFELPEVLAEDVFTAVNKMKRLKK